MSWLSEALHHGDAAAISAIAAWAAAGVALIGATFQFFIGRKQAKAALVSANAALKNADNAGRHTRADFRQKWIDKVIDTLSEHNSILLTIPSDPSTDDRRKLAALRTRLGILLNPNEAGPIELMKVLDSMLGCPADKRGESAERAVQIARRHLKAEWVRIKADLE